MTVSRHRTRIKGAALATAVLLGLAACSGGGKVSDSGGSSGGGGQVADTERFTIAMITHEAPGDSFWDKIRNGAKVAAAKDNIDLKYSNNRVAGGQASLIQQAIDAKVDAIATTLSAPAALAQAVEAARAADIPVVAFNAGLDQYKDLGAMMYFGSDENLAGTTAGERIAAAGGKKTLCVIQEAGQVQLEARCNGVKKGMTNTENIQVDGTSTASVTSTILAKLQQDPSIDYVVTLGAPIALAALDAKKTANSQAKIVTFDLNADVAKAIKDKTMEFSVDQQPYLQGYEAIDSLWLYLTNRNDLGGGQPVLTGPSFVDSTNIDAISEYAAKGTR